MGITIEEHRVLQFADGVRTKAQQSVSKLYSYVGHNFTLQGKAGSINAIGSVDPQKREGRYAETKLQNVDHYVRWYFADTYDWATLIDSQDKLQMLYDPTSKYTAQAGKGFARLLDDVIINAAFADVVAGEERGSTISWASQTGQIIVHGSTGLTLAKLLTLKELIGVNEEEDGEWVFVGSPQQRTNLLNTTEVKNADYNTVRALAAGQINTFMGFEFLWSNRLLKSSTTRRCLCFKKGSGIELVEPKKLESKASERADKNYITQVWLSCMAGAVRAEELEVVEVQCTETA